MLVSCLFVAAWAVKAQAFHVLPTPSLLHSKLSALGVQNSRNPSNSEYIVEDEHDDKSPEQQSSPPAVFSDRSTSEVRLTNPEPAEQEYGQPPTGSSKEGEKMIFQYAALPPGTVVQIQVGDVGLARKAWKKRRRSGSPLLVPCSVLNVDRASTVRWSLIYLLEKFGRSAGNRGGTLLSLASLAQRYRSHLKSSLTKQAKALGSDDPKALVQALFNQRVQESYGIKMTEDENGEIFLQAPVSRMRAQKRAAQSPVLQVADDFQQETLKHTGVVRSRRAETPEEDASNIYQLQPLSAALRVNQKEDVDGGQVQTGSMHTAVVFHYDAAGDAGAPLLTLSLNSAPRERLRFGADSKYDSVIRSPKHMLKELKAGEGPLRGKVVRMIKGGALVDCGIGRRVSSRSESDMVRVLGMLRFQDAVIEQPRAGVPQPSWSEDADGDDEAWKDILSFDELEVDDVKEEMEEEDEAELEELEKEQDVASLFNFDDQDDVGADVEDITHLFTTETDGSLTYTDPDTGGVQQVSTGEYLEDDEEDDEDEDEAVIDEMATELREEIEDEIGEDVLLSVVGKIGVPQRNAVPMDIDEDDKEDEEDGPVVFQRPAKNVAKTTDSTFRTKRLHVGDEVKVYVRSVAKQSNQIFFSMKSSIVGKKPKDIKEETEREKKLGRLLKQVGGMQQIRRLEGRIMNGTVKAISHTGDWLYIEPQEDSLPVGIAFGDETLRQGLAKGDTVRIQLEGVDETRGQLSMKVLSRDSDP
jgi:hypothetical protein